MLRKNHCRDEYYKRVIGISGFLIIALLGGQSAFADSLGWYNGAFNEVNAVSNYQTQSGGLWNYVFDNFIVPSGGWQIVGAFSNNITNVGHTANAAHWEIRTGIADGNLGTVVASGTNSATWTPTGTTWAGYTEYRAAVSGLNVNLTPGEYWLSVAPIIANSNPVTYLSMTSGAGAVGSPSGNDGKSFGIYQGLSYPENMSTRFLGPTDFSLGLNVRTGASQTEALLPIFYSDWCAPYPLPCTYKFQNVSSGLWFDPAWAFGYNYMMTSGSLFTGILDFPTGLGDQFNVSVGGTSLGLFGPGMSVDFTVFPGGGVEKFSVTGINPLVDPSNPLAFPLQLSFSTPAASFDMEALPNTNIPEPSSVLLLGSGIAFICLASRRRIK